MFDKCGYRLVCLLWLVIVSHERDRDEDRQQQGAEAAEHEDREDGARGGGGEANRMKIIPTR